MARIPYPNPTDSSAEFLNALGSDPINLARMFGHAEPAALGLLNFGGKLLQESEFDPKLRELVILRICALTSCDYEAGQHRPHAQAAGLTDAEIEAACRGASDKVLTDEQRSILSFTEALIARSGVTDELFCEVEKRLTNRQLVEFLLVIGFYTMICWTINGLSIDPERG